MSICLCLLFFGRSCRIIMLKLKVPLRGCGLFGPDESPQAHELSQRYLGAAVQVRMLQDGWMGHVFLMVATVSFLFIVFKYKLHMDSYVETMWFIIGLSWDGDDAWNARNHDERATMCWWTARSMKNHEFLSVKTLPLKLYHLVNLVLKWWRHGHKHETLELRGYDERRFNPLSSRLTALAHRAFRSVFRQGTTCTVSKPLA